MQAELLRLTDALQTASRQIVLTSDRPPADIEALDERLIRRFAGGLIIDVAAPDYETRVAILRRKAEERRATFADGVLEAVAGLDIDNVRELLGALNRIIAFQAVSEKPLAADQARLLVGGEVGGGRDRSQRRVGQRGGARESGGRRHIAGGAAGAGGAPPWHRPLRRRVGVRRLPVRDHRHRRPAGRCLARQGQRGRPPLAGRGLPDDPARAAARAGDGARPRARAPRVQEEVERLQALQAEAAALGPSWPGRPPSAIRPTSPPQRKRCARPARRDPHRPRLLRSGGWIGWSRLPANRAWCSRQISAP